jgi:hypothetical protein
MSPKLLKLRVGDLSGSQKGLLHDTYMVHSNVIFAAVITGGNKCEYLSIRCIKLEPSESCIPFTVRRRHFFLLRFWLSR